MTHQHIAAGIWQLRFGTPERDTPVSMRRTSIAHAALDAMAPSETLSIDQNAIRVTHRPRGTHLILPLGPDEQIYGLGLQLKGFNHRNKKRTLRVNSDPTVDLGDSHAPVPFYVSTAGYGILIDTARYASLYFGATKFVSPPSNSPKSDDSGMIEVEGTTAVYSNVQSSMVEIDVPTAQGIDIYVFDGPTMLEAVRRYVLFSGGGPIVPRWGLGVWYRGFAKATQDEIIALADGLRDSKIPCDVMGLEPGWQTNAYSCSHAWSHERFPNPRNMASELLQRGMRVNNWTHAFTHPESPMYEELIDCSGDHEVWSGVVPDFGTEKARRVFQEYYGKSHVDLGISGYKLDECDNSDFMKSPWSFPESSAFPSGLDGEQYHSMFGLQFQSALDDMYRARNQRSYHLVRNSHALASPYPFVLYSDLYAHDDFIRGLVNSGFSGLLWSPEVRHATSKEDLIRRLQTTVFSPLAQINAWYIKNPPWKQWVREKNNADEFADAWEEAEQACRQVLELRMQFLPYLYSAFVRYEQQGIPPFRALVMDYPDDPQVRNCDDQYLMGDRLLVAPIITGKTSRDVYLPQGQWRDFWTGELLEGGSVISVTPSLSEIPLYVVEGSILPLAQVTTNTDDPNSFKIHIRVYGDGSRAADLYEDDGLTLTTDDEHRNRVSLTWDGASNQVTVERIGNANVPQYEIIDWEHVG